MVNTENVVCGVHMKYILIEKCSKESLSLSTFWCEKLLLLELGKL